MYNIRTSLFSEPRAYFHVNVPLNRYGQKVDREHVYEVVENISVAYRDPEMGRTAVYVKTDKPIKVKEIDYTQFENKKMSDLGLDF